MRWRHAAAAGAAALGVMLAAALTILHAALARDYIPLADLAAFRGTLPFQARVLVPGLVHLVRPDDAPVLPLYLAIEWLAWLALLISAAWAVRELGCANPMARLFAPFTVVAPVAVHLLLPTRFRVVTDAGAGDLSALSWRLTALSPVPNYYYPWDVPSAVFVILLLILLLRWSLARTLGRAAVLLVVFAAATLNRETTVLLVPLTAAIAWRHPHGRRRVPDGTRQTARPSADGRASRCGWLWLPAAQVVVWAALEGGIRALVAAPPNPRARLPGGSYEWMLWTNLRTLATPAYAVAIVPLFAAGCWIPVVTRWRRVPRWWRHVLLLWVAPSVAVTLVVGIALETRVFVEPAAGLWLIAIASFVRPRTPSRLWTEDAASRLEPAGRMQ